MLYRPYIAPPSLPYFALLLYLQLDSAFFLTLFSLSYSQTITTPSCLLCLLLLLQLVHALFLSSDSQFVPTAASYLASCLSLQPCPYIQERLERESESSVTLSPAIRSWLSYFDLGNPCDLAYLCQDNLG